MVFSVVAIIEAVEILVTSAIEVLLVRIQILVLLLDDDVWYYDSLCPSASYSDFVGNRYPLGSAMFQQNTVCR